MSRLTIKRSQLRRLRWLTAASALALIVSTVAMAYAGNNPQPNTGAPHGTGISHQQYPNGYKLNGQFAASFDNYIDYSNGAPNDERNFLGARVFSPTSLPTDGSFETRKKLKVKPGDKIAISAFIHNDGGTSGNGDGSGPSVAKNTRVYFNFPTNQSAPEVQLGAFIRSNNAVVSDQHLDAHTISDNMSFISETGQPIKLKYIVGKGRLLQTNMAKNASDTSYQSWGPFTAQQEYWMFTGQISNVGGIPEENPTLGLPIGSNGSYQSGQSVGTSQAQQLDWFGCEQFHGYVQFQVEVEAGPTPTESPSGTPTPTESPTFSPTPTPTETPTSTPTPTETPTAPPVPTESPIPPSPPAPPAPPAPPKGTLPVTGTSTMALLSAIALAISGYLYLRERKSLKQAISRYTVGK